MVEVCVIIFLSYCVIKALTQEKRDEDFGRFCSFSSSCYHQEDGLLYSSHAALSFSIYFLYQKCPSPRPLLANFYQFSK